MADTTTLRDMLHRLAEVLTDAEARAQGLQSLDVAHTRRSDDIVRLQALDLLTQELAAAAHVLRNLAEQAPADCLVSADPALDGLSLSSIAGRMAGVATSAVETASLELF